MGLGWARSQRRWTALARVACVAACAAACAGTERGGGLVVAQEAGGADEGEAVPGGCQLELYMLFDTSGSMNDEDAKCLRFLREEAEEAGAELTDLDKRKPCWSLVSRFAREAHRLVRGACRAANQGDPETSMVVFRCPNTGQDRKILLAPTNDAASIESAFADLENQRLAGQSCAWGALDQARDWIKEANLETNAEAGISAAVGAPDDLVDKSPVVFALTDGELDDSGSERLSQRLRENFDVLFVTAKPFLGNAEIKKLERLAQADLVFDATDLSSLNRLSLSLGNFVPTGNDFATCTAEQESCVEARRAFLEGTNETGCSGLSELYTAVAACAGSGCSGINITPEKQACLEAQDRCPGLVCSDIVTHINAQNYDSVTDELRGYEAGSATPGLLANNRRSDLELGDLQQLVSVATTPQLAGGAAEPVLANDGDVIVGSNELLKVDHETHEVVWSVSPVGQGAVFGTAIVGASGASDVFVGDSNGVAYRIDEGTGAIKRVWNLGPGAIRAAPALPEGATYVIFAVDAVPGAQPVMLHKLLVDGPASATGPRQAWQRPACSDDAAEFDFVVGGVILTEDQAVLLVCNLGVLERFSALSGEREWRVDTFGSITSPAAVLASNSSLVLVSSNETRTAVVKFGFDGSQVWGNAVALEVDASPMVDPSSQSVFILSRSGVLFRYEAATGVLEGEAALVDRELRSPFLAPVDAAGIAMICEQTLVHVVSLATLQVQGSYSTSGPITSSALIAEGADGKFAVFVSTVDTLLERLEASPAQTLRRVLQADQETPCLENDEWPAGAIAATVILLLVLLVLLAMLFRGRNKK